MELGILCLCVIGGIVIFNALKFVVRFDVSTEWVLSREGQGIRERIFLDRETDYGRRAFSRPSSQWKLEDAA